ncbi:MAG: helix-turn-helix domain-containing protein [Deltaproteobacteria bacterium]|nr:helix-turn-helix domain-containing protein [Deltaproteobacteria bacterium]MBW2046038.1 helix-turn-helix domain-containing protein [Deltaproteobacteria bacterium]
MALDDMQTPEDRYFDLQSLSNYSGVSVSALRDYIRRDNLPCFKLRGKVVVKRSEFDSWIEQFRYHPTEDLDRIADEVIQSLKSESQSEGHGG